MRTASSTPTAPPGSGYSHHERHTNIRDVELGGDNAVLKRRVEAENRGVRIVSAWDPTRTQLHTPADDDPGVHLHHNLWSGLLLINFHGAIDWGVIANICHGIGCLASTLNLEQHPTPSEHLVDADEAEGGERP